MPTVWTEHGDDGLGLAVYHTVALMEALKTQMNTLGISPKFTSTHNRHNVAKMVPPAVSVAVMSAAFPFESGSLDYLVTKGQINISIRYHHDFLDGDFDHEAIRQVMQSIVNKMGANKVMVADPDGFIITDIGDVAIGITFEESRTIGGQLRVSVLHTTTITGDT